MGNNKTNSSISFIADGNCREYNFTFEIFDEANIKLYLGDALQDKGFYITRDKNTTGGNVFFEKAPDAGTLITILRSIPLKRMTDFKEGGPFRASKVNYEFDYQLACMEQLFEKTERILSIPPYFPNDANVDLPLPDRGKAIIWDENAKALRNSDVEIDEFYDTYLEAKKLYTDSKSALADIENNTAKVEACASIVDNIFENLSSIMSKVDTKADLTFQNTDMSDYIVESWCSDDKSSWYIMYKSGWIMQGGVSATGANVVFPKPFSVSCWSANVTSLSYVIQGYLQHLPYIPSTINLVSVRHGGGNHGFTWLAFGI